MKQTIEFTPQFIRSIFSEQDYRRGLEYYRQKRVTSLNYDEDENSLRAVCKVTGNWDNYRVSVTVKNDGRLNVSAGCTCPQFAKARRCKHIAAALLALADRERAAAQPSERTSSGGRRLIDLYKSQSSRELLVDRDRKARLVPRLIRGYGRDYPSFTFQVGFDKLYVVKDVFGFLYSVHRGEEAEYGKNLILNHDIGQFDDFSRQMISIMMGEFTEFVVERHDGYSYSLRSGMPKNEMHLTGNSFDRWFDLFRGGEMLCGGRNSIAFLESDPKVDVGISALGKRVQIQTATVPQVSFFGNNQKLYAIGEDSIMRCSEEFRKDVFPMMSVLHDDIWLSRNDVGAFCSYVLPRIRRFVSITDKEGILDGFMPDAMTPCYYFDIESGVLTAKLIFRYGDETAPMRSAPDATPSIRRDEPAEQAAEQPLKRSFAFDPESMTYRLSDDDEIFSFLTDRLSEFSGYGEVYISESLKNKRIPSRWDAQVGVSVSDGLLSLNIDTGVFPLEELEALYHSLIQKKTYHKLSDGRYLELDGSPYEKLAEAAHFLQLSPEELRGGSVTMPAFRGLYLDSILNGDEGLSVKRDASYRAMLRCFKSIGESDYVLPGDFESILRPYQKYGFRWLKTLEANGFGGILADEMGLGKTVQMIAWLSTVPQSVTGMPSLIVCPASLILNWADEFTKFAPELRVQLIMGSAAERKRCIEGGDEYDVLVTSYDLIKRDIQSYAEKEFYCTILDEAQNIKNRSTLASKAVKKLNCRQRFILTGTPVENRLSELWNLFDFLMPGYLYTHGTFMDKLEKPIAQSKNVEAGKRLSMLVQPFVLRRMKRDVLRELPPKIEHTQHIGFTEEERKVYLAFAAATKESFTREGRNKLDILTALTRLRQICCDPNLCIENYTGAASKLDACIELCETMVENGHRILLFSQFTSMLARIRERLDGLDISSLTLDGSTPKQRRRELVDAFQNGAASVFLISLKAGGTGLNLTAADVVIHYDPWWNLSAQNQATDRAHRIGQDTTVHVYRLIVKDSVEEKILELQDRKAELLDVVASGSGIDLSSMSASELLELFD